MFFFVRTNNPRPTFHQDMTPEERAVMVRHVEYWTAFARSGVAIAFGPVMDPAGVYGIGVYSANDEAHMRKLLADDPANGVLTYEVHPMPRLVTKGTARLSEG